MTHHERERERQRRYRQRRKKAGFRRLDVWVPADVMAELERRWTPYGDFCQPQLALITLARQALNLPKPPRDRNFRTP